MNHAAAARFLLAVCFLVLLFSGGARFAIGLLLHPMAHDLSWSRSTLSFSVTVFMVLSACALPLVGHLVDRFGARAVLAVSVLATALALAAMSLIESPGEARSRARRYSTPTARTRGRSSRCWSSPSSPSASPWSCRGDPAGRDGFEARPD